MDISKAILLFEQYKDAELIKIIKYLNNNRISKFKNFTICNHSKLLFNPSDEIINNELSLQCIVMPNLLIEKCIRLHHYDIEKTYKNICNKFYWKGLYSDVVNYIKSRLHKNMY